MSKIYLSFLLLLQASLLYAQLPAPSPTFEWQKCLGGSAMESQTSTMLIPAADKGFLVVGSTKSDDGDVVGNNGNEDAWLVKLDSAGNIQWKKCYGGSSIDWFTDGVQTPDGGYLLVGGTSSADSMLAGLPLLGDMDAWLVKINAAGDIVWQKRYGGANRDLFDKIGMMSSGNFIIAGITASHDGNLTSVSYTSAEAYWYVKIDPAGNILVQKAHNKATVFETIRSLKITPDNGFIRAGTLAMSGTPTSGFKGGFYDAYVIKCDSTLTMQWDKAYGGTNLEEMMDVVPVAGGNYIAVGYTNSMDGDVTKPIGGGANDAWILKLNSTGGIVWERCKGGTLSDQFMSVYSVAGGVVACARTASGDVQVETNRGAEDFWIVRLDDTAGFVWRKTLGGSFNDVPTYVCQTQSGGIVAAGYTLSNNGDVKGYHGIAGVNVDIWVTKLSSCPAAHDVTIHICPGDTLDFYGTKLFQTGVYYDTLSGGCLSYVKLNLIVNPTPAPKVWATTGNIISTNEFRDYTWYLDNQLLTWAVDRQSFTAEQSGRYRVVVADSAGCPSDTVTYDYLMNGCQAPEIEWAKSYGGSSADEAMAMSISAKGYYVLGHTLSTDHDVKSNNGARDIWLIRLKTNGDTVWTRALGGSGNEFGNDVKATADGGCIIIGYTNSTNGDITANNGGNDVWVVKLDSNGVITWQKCYGGTGTEQGQSIYPTTDGGYIFVGRTNTTNNTGDVSGNHGSYDAWVVKINDVGTIQWKKCLGGNGVEYGYAVQQTSDGGYIIGIHTNSSGNGDVPTSHGTGGTYDYWLVKLDASGILMWSRMYGGTQNEYVYAVKQTLDGGYMAMGRSNSNDGDVTDAKGDYDYWVLKVNDAGGIQWKKNFGGKSIENGYANNIVQLADSTYLIAGASNSNTGDVSGAKGDYDQWMLKLSPSGDILWKKNLGDNGVDYAYSVQVDDNNNILLAGYANAGSSITDNNGGSDFWVVKLGTCRTCTYPILDSICIGGSIEFRNQIITTAGIYTDTLRDANDCDSVLGIKVIVHPLPAPVVTVNGGTLSTGTFVTYQWLLNGQPVAGATSKNYNPDRSGSYSVLVRDANGCEDTSAAQSYIHTGVASIVGDTGISVYPNPATTEIIVHAENAGSITVALHTLDGRDMGTYKTHSSTAVVDVRDMPAGVYLLKAATGDGRVMVQKIVKQ